ncbi:MAG: archease [Pyrobaculum sp.]|uniref:Protein archease n=2 Tax=Pyrobaculum arsenaticum TaxID=121277 RepID=A4WLW5_PYRAR|nr:archease [Pyrobaculum arsenaticum]ABP51382.1 archease family protein [Pyrobaculum arsenaticum DSM 13514]MCY0889389.1 archease [Pyrobaculum arsenaticum]NYR16248.1 archease [Pyrobaculum arsenaticum]
MGNVACVKPADYKYGEHTADVLIEAYGCTLEEAFRNAAIAYADLTYYTERVEPRLVKSLDIEYDDLEGLLFKWIDELLYLFDAEKFAISRKIEVMIEQDGGYRLRAIIYGETYDINKHGFTGLIVKAMTFHMLEIAKVGDYWKLQFVVDI